MAFQVLLVEDNPGDVRLTREALRRGRVPTTLSVVSDGAQALRFLLREGEFAESARPDLILLDWNLPLRSGGEVLGEVKRDPSLRQIPVIVLTSSNAEREVSAAYDLNANCYMTKPLRLDEFAEVIKAIEDFWLSAVRLPTPLSG